MKFDVKMPSPSVSPKLPCRAASVFKRWFFSHSVMPDSVTPWPVAHQAPLSMKFLQQNTEVDCHFLLQRIFLTQESNSHLLHHRWVLYHWATSVINLIPFVIEECTIYKSLLHSLGSRNSQERRPVQGLLSQGDILDSGSSENGHKAFQIPQLRVFRAGLEPGSPAFSVPSATLCCPPRVSPQLPDRWGLHSSSTPEQL